MSKENGLTIYEEIDKIRGNANVKAKYMQMQALSNFKTIGSASLYCSVSGLDLGRVLKSVAEFRRMPNNEDRLYYLECKKLVDKGIKINLI